MKTTITKKNKKNLLILKKSVVTNFAPNTLEKGSITIIATMPTTATFIS